MLSNNNYFTVDVEDWYHLLDLSDAPPIDKWSSIESRLEVNLSRIIELLVMNNIKATYFVLGWIAEKHKPLIRELHASGNEIASHGYSHILYHKSSIEDVKNDISKSKQVIEDIIGSEIVGFRSPGFSIKKDNMWIFEEIYQAGYKYDSSVFPALRGHGGNIKMPTKPFLFDHGLIEYPIGVCNVIGMRVPFGGGGYFRLLPLVALKYLTKLYHKEVKLPFVFYIHPREIDKAQPRMQMNLRRKFQAYVNIKNTYKKLELFIPVSSFGGLLRDVDKNDLDILSL